MKLTPPPPIEQGIAADGAQRQHPAEQDRPEWGGMKTRRGLVQNPELTPMTPMTYDLLRLSYSVNMSMEMMP